MYVVCDLGLTQIGPQTRPIFYAGHAEEKFEPLIYMISLCSHCIDPGIDEPSCRYLVWRNNSVFLKLQVSKLCIILGPLSGLALIV